MPEALSSGDLALFEKIGVGPELLIRAQIARVGDREARELLSANGASGDFSGILFPIISPVSGFRQSYVVRRDHPELENGKAKDKYRRAYGDRSHLYCGPGAAAVLKDLSVPAVLVEAQKSVLALEAWGERTGRKIFPLGTGGCWSWRGRIGRTESANGERVDEVGPLPDLAEYCAGRLVYILLDSNSQTNPKVAAAQRDLAKTLRRVKAADVRVLRLPASEGVNGPDDLISRRGDAAMARVFESEVVVTKDGSIRGNLANAISLLRESPDWVGVLAFNEFSLYITAVKPTPWPRSAGANWSDRDAILAAEWLQHHGVEVNTSQVDIIKKECVDQTVIRLPGKVPQHCFAFRAI